MKINLNKKHIKLGTYTTLLFLGIYLCKAIFVQIQYFQNESPVAISADAQTTQPLLPVTRLPASPFSEINKDEIKNEIWISEFSLKLKDWLMAENNIQRSDLIGFGMKEPLLFVGVAKEMLLQMPEDLVEARSQTLSLAIDVADGVQKNEDVEVKEAYFSVASEIAKHELDTAELVDSPMINQLNDEQLDVLAHDGFIIEQNNKFYRSSLGPKVLSILLTAQDPNLNRRAEVLQKILSSSIGRTEEFTHETLAIVAMQKLGP